MAEYYSIVTESGTKKLVEAVGSDNKIKIVTFAVGDGGGSNYAPTGDMTALKNEVWRGNVKSCEVNEGAETLLVVEAVIPSSVGGFTIREMGVYDEEGTLIAVCNTPETQKGEMSDGVLHELDLSMEIAIGNTNVIELAVDPNVVVATQRDIQELRAEMLKITTDIRDEMLDITTNIQNLANSNQRNIVELAMAVEMLTASDTLELENVVVEAFENAEDITLLSGYLNKDENYIYA